MIAFDCMVPPEVLLERLLHDKHSRKECQFEFITSRLTIENLPSGHIYRWLVDWMNQQLSDIGVNSSGGRPLPPIHFDLVQVRNDVASAHVFEADGFAFIVVAQPMVDEMLRLSHALVEQNRAFMRLQIAPTASFQKVAQLLLFMQFCIVTTHEYSHLVRHLRSFPPGDIGGSLSQAQELDADGFGIYHALTYFFEGRGRLFTSQWLKISSNKALENSILDCFLLSMMLQFCARWAGKTQVVWNDSVEHPPQPVRIEYSILFVEMWCREVGKISTSWMTDGTLNQYFNAAASLFPSSARSSWNLQMSWLRGQTARDTELKFGRTLIASEVERVDSRGRESSPRSN